MRKVFITSFLILLSVALISGSAYAVTGVCSSCHTMHNSQDNLAQARVYSSGSLVTTDAPQKILLKGDCIGCHSSTTGSTIVSNTPIVFNTTAYPASPLAGGNFYSSVTDEKTKRHNVKDLTSTTDIAPPGFKQATKPSEFNQGLGTGWGPTTWSAGTQVTCAGEYGCHGNRSTGYDNYAGIRGGHHNNATTCDGSTVGKSFRFLSGIKGVELNSPDANRWEQTASPTAHNGYYGSTASDDNTISYLCGECHGKFHTWVGGGSEVGTGSPWLRHPTDIALTASSGSTFTTDYTTYNVETPVASASPSTNDSTVNTSSIVMCLSCHRAHGTNEPDILRFTYNMQAGSGGTTGCLMCHKGQR